MYDLQPSTIATENNNETTTTMIFVWSSEGGPLQLIGLVIFALQFIIPQIFDLTTSIDVQNGTIDINGISAKGGTVGVALAGNVATAAAAQSSITNIDAALQTLTSHRATFGAKQNRLESAIRNMENIVENQSAARSRLRDADFARETAELTRTQILQQAGVAMLAQANQLPQNVLQLLG